MDNSLYKGRICIALQRSRLRRVTTKEAASTDEEDALFAKKQLEKSDYKGRRCVGRSTVASTKEEYALFAKM